MKPKRIFVSLLVFFIPFIPQLASATHIVGGEMYYQYVSGNTYNVTMIIYRDCANGVPPFDNPASIGVFNQNNSLVQLLQVFVNPDSSYIPSIVNNPCFIPPTNICYVKATYNFTVNLPPTSSIYYLVYQRCCRNNTIQNIIGPDATGATYLSEIRVSNVFNNSSPKFNQLPPPFICSNFPFDFDHSATDPDNDSLVYSLCTPIVGGDTLNPAPNPPTAPPYNNVIYAPPYNINNMLNGVPGIQPLSINSITGQLTATPNTIGQFVVGVCVKEYRNNVYLGESRRDFQLNVVPCPSLIVAAFLNPITSCGNNTVTFQNGSFGAIAYHWDFGVPNSTTDTSNLTNPVFTYPDTGSYTVTLIAYSIFNPGCADTVQGIVNINSALNTDFTFTKDLCTNQFQFKDTLLTPINGTLSFQWNFGDNSTSTLNDPVHAYAAPGNYVVTLITTTSLGCKDTIQKTVTAVPPLSANSSVINNAICNMDCNGSGFLQIVNNQGPFTIAWTNPPGNTNDTLINLCKGTYTATITDSAGCVATGTLVITEPPALTLNASATVDYCNGKCIGTSTTIANGGTPPYSYIWSNGNTSSNLTNLCAGTYSVSITDANGCTANAVSVNVPLSDSIPTLSVIPDSAIIYYGQSVNITATQASNYTYSWQPASFLNNSSIANPVSTPIQSIDYILTIADQYGCRNTDSVHILVIQYKCAEPEIYIPNAFSPNDDGKNDLIYVYGGQIKDLLFRIYDRWGEKVFETNKPRTGWDGTYKGTKVMPGVFVYYVEATCYDDEKFFKKGNITIIR